MDNLALDTDEGSNQCFMNGEQMVSLIATDEKGEHISIGGMPDAMPCSGAAGKIGFSQSVKIKNRIISFLISNDIPVQRQDIEGGVMTRLVYV